MDGKRSAPLGTRTIERFLRDYFALAGGTVSDHIGGLITPSIEVRPIRADEHFLFGVQLVTVYAQIGAGGAGRFGFCEIAAGGPAGQTAYDLMFQRVWITGADAQMFAANSTQVGALNTSVPPFQMRDNAWVPGSTIWGAGAWFPPIAGALQGDVAGSTGRVFSRIVQNTWTDVQLVLRPNPQLTPFVSVMGLTANAALHIIMDLALAPQDSALG